MVNFGNTPSFNDSTKYVLNCSLDQFFLQAAEEYSHKSLSGRLLDRVYRRLSIEMMQRLGYSKKDADTMFNDALALEAKLAEVCMTTEEQNNPEYLSKINN